MGRWVTTSQGRRLYIPDEGEENPYTKQIDKEIADKERQIAANKAQADQKNGIVDKSSLSDAVKNLDVKSIKATVDEIKKAYDEIRKKENDWEYTDQIRDLQRDFYRKYSDLARSARNIVKEMSISGYGLTDASKVRIRELLTSLDYNFPYGWKH